MKLLILWRKLLRDSLQQGGFHILANAYIMVLGVSSIFEASKAPNLCVHVPLASKGSNGIKQDRVEPAKSEPYPWGSRKHQETVSLVITPPKHIIVPHPNAYLVGGSVRDLIRGSTPFDYDIAVAQEPEVYAAKLARQLGSRVIPLGKKPFTVYRVVAGTTSVDVAAMNGTSIESDLKARDFTINALACELANGQIIDTTRGLDDLKHHTIRMVSYQAFRADPIRLLRAFRMAAVMNYYIEPRTLEAIADGAATIQRSAGERVLSELHKTLACPHSHRSIVKMAETGLLAAIFPELIPLQTCRQNRYHAEDVFNHSLNAYRQMENILASPEDRLSGETARFVTTLGDHKRILLKMALLLHDIGKPQSRSKDDTGEIHFYGHAKLGVTLLQPICRRLRMSNFDCEWLAFIIGNHQRPLELFLSANNRSGKASSKAVGRFFRKCGDHAPSLLLHALADNLVKIEQQNTNVNGMHQLIVDLLFTYFESIQTRRANPLINGDDLIRSFGLSPSPLFGSILGQIEDAYLAGSIQNRDQALEWVKNLIHQPPSCKES